MTDLAPFPDLESAVIELLAGLGTLDTETPADLASNVPFIRVNRLSGNDDFFNDLGHIDVDVFGVKGDRTALSDLARLVQQRLIRGPHVLSECVIDRVATDVSPKEVPWANEAFRLFTATYSITARRPISA